jgi:hypothetical protein
MKELIDSKLPVIFYEVKSVEVTIVEWVDIED